jgi:autoinducer 2 (AI-2) kinase
VVVGGSFWQQLCVTAAPISDDGRRLRTLCHLRPGQWILEATGFYSGLALRWFRDAFMRGGSDRVETDAYDQMTALADVVPVGARGLVAVVSGLQQEQGWPRVPVSLMGFDLTRAHLFGRGECIRAIMESAIYVTMSHIAMIEACSAHDFSTLRFTGGASRAALWCQMLADATGKEVVVPRTSEASAVGAAVLGSHGMGWFGSVEEATAALVARGATYQPDASLRATYGRLHDRWRLICDYAAASAAAWD